MDEDLKILVGLDVDTKIKDIDKVQSEIEANNHLNIKLKAAIDNSSNAINMLFKDLINVKEKVENKFPSLKLKVTAKDVIIPRNIGDSIRSEIKRSFESSTVDMIPDISVKISKLEGIEDIKAQINEFNEYLNNSLSVKTVKIEPETYQPTKEQLREIQNYLDLINKLDNKNRNVNKIQFVSPDREEFKKFEYIGEVTNLDSFYQELGKQFSKINDLTKVSANKFQDYINQFYTYTRMGGTRSFDNFFKNNLSMLNLLTEAQNKIASKSSVVKQNGQINKSTNTKGVNDLAEAVERLNAAIGITPAKVETFSKSINTLLDKYTDKISKLEELIEIIQAAKTELSTSIFKNTDSVENNQNTNIKKDIVDKNTDVSTVKNNFESIRKDTIRSYQLIKALKESLDNPNYTSTVLHAITSDFNNSYAEISYSIDLIEEKINELSKLLGTEMKATIVSSITDDIRKATEEIKNAEIDVINKAKEILKEQQNSKDKQGKSKNKSISLNKNEIKKFSKDIATVEGTLSSIAGVSDNTFNSMVSDVSNLKKNFTDLQKALKDDNLTIEEKTELYSDFLAELQKVKNSVADYKKKYDIVTTTQTKTQAQIEAKKAKDEAFPKPVKYVDVSNTSYTAETKDLEKIRQELSTIQELSNKKILNISADKYDAQDNIKKLSVVAEDAQGSLESLSFTLETIDENDSKGLVYAGKTLTTLQEEADKAEKALKELMLEYSNKVGNIQVDKNGNIQSQNKIYENANSTYSNAINQINSQLLQAQSGNTSVSREDFLNTINRETQALKNQLSFLEKRDEIVRKVSSQSKSLVDYINNNSLKSKKTVDISNDIEYVEKLKDAKIDLFDEAELEIAQKSLEDIYDKFKNIKAIEKNDTFLKNRDSEIKAMQASMNSLLENSPKIRKDPELFSQWEQIYNRINTDYIDSESKIGNIKKEIRALNAEFKSLGVTQSGFFDKVKANIVKFSEWFGISQAVMYAVDAMKQMISVSIELDKQLTNLQIASGYTEEKTRSLLKSYSDLAQSLGATTTQVSAAADSWLRQGYNIQETNELISNSMILSKVGQLESAEATQYLTSAMKGYNVQAADSLEIVDKLSAVDMEAAVSAGGLAEAMSRTASGAQLAGIEMDKLIGYATVIGETTQKSMDTVGESLKSIFARMGQIKAGRLEDPETGEDLSNVETSLGNVGIDLREQNNEFRNFGDVLDEIGGKWDSYNSVQQRAIANSIAGIHQYENFVVLMEHYDEALNYATISAESNGTAMQKFAIYQESAEAKINKTTAAFENLSYTMMNTDLIKAGLDGFTGFLNITEEIISNLGLIPTLLGSISAVATLSNKNAGKLSMPSYWENNYIQLIGCRKGA